MVDLIDTNGVKPTLKKGVLGYDDYSVGGDAGRLYVGTGTASIAQAKKSEVDSHTSNVSNPHSVTKAQVGLGNVDNTSDVNKPVSTATQTALNTKVDKVTSTDNAIVRFDGTTGLVQNSGVIIDDSNNVGIGTSSPISKLSISGYLNSQDSSNNGALYLGQYLNGNGAYGGFEWNNTACILGLRTQGAYPINFTTNNTERMRINSDGNLLIGTSTDDGVNKLQVSGGIKNVLQQTTVSDSNSGVYADTVEHTRTYNSHDGDAIAKSVFGNVPMIGELYAIEHGTSKYLRATIFKASYAAVVDVTVHASSGLTVAATNSNGTIQLGGYTVSSNVRMMTKLRKIY